MAAGFRAVIFDVDGVLVDSYHAHLESWVLMAREHGLHITEEEFATTFGQTSREIIARFWGPRLSPADREALDARKEAIYRDLIRARFPAMDGAVELIDALAAAGFLLAVRLDEPALGERPLILDRLAVHVAEAELQELPGPVQVAPVDAAHAHLERRLGGIGRGGRHGSGCELL